MAVNLTESEIKRGVTEWAALPEELDVVPEMNGRHDLPEIESLIESILEFGQLQPVLIRRTGGRPVLCAGFRRWRAVDEINTRKLYKGEPLRLRCSYTALTERQAFLANIAENQERKDTTPMDDAYNIQRLVNVYQMDLKDIAKSYGKDVAWVKDRIALMEATPAIEKQIRAGKIKAPAAKKIAKLSKEHQDRLAALAQERGKVTPADIRREVGEPDTPAKSQKEPEKTFQPEAPKANGHDDPKQIGIELARAVITEDLTPTDTIKLAYRLLATYGLKA